MAAKRLTLKHAKEDEEADDQMEGGTHS